MSLRISYSINKAIFSPEVSEESDEENEEQSFEYYLQDLERTKSRLTDLGIKKNFKPRRPWPSNLKDIRLQKNIYFQTKSSNKSSVILR